MKELPTTKELLKARMAEVRVQVEEIKGRTSTERERLDQLIAQQNALDAEIVALTAKVRVHDPELRSAKMELSAIAKALGSITLSGK